jgi:three-Cys-motif partner protein
MPKVDNVGYGELTPVKIEMLSKILDMHLIITQAVIARNSYFKQTYHYIDLTAGKGYSPDGKVKGSPLVLLDSVHSEKIRIPCKIDLIECEEKNYSELDSNIQKYCKQNGWDPGNIHLHRGNYEAIVKDILPSINEMELGLIFVDPSGNLPDFEILDYIARMRPRMEILVYIPTTNVKRQKGKLLSEYMKDMEKEYWLVRKPFSWDKHKWTFLLGCSHPTIFKNYKAIDFVRLDSPEAEGFFPKLNLSAKQRMTQIQPELPFPEQDN